MQKMLKANNTKKLERIHLINKFNYYIILTKLNSIDEENLLVLIGSSRPC